MIGRRIAKLSAAVGLVLGLGAAALDEASAQPGLKPQVEAFISRMQREHGFDISFLRATFVQLKANANVVKAYDAPATAKPWSEFRKLFLTPVRIDGGVAFWRDNADLLRKARETFGVPEEIIVAVLGVESIYGRRIGGYRVIEALYTLGFEEPRRPEFFRDELEQFLLLARDNGFDPLSIPGSFAGAMGMPQFVASSYRRYAVDFDGDGRVDLWNSTADIVGSVANYLRSHGWEAGKPVASPARMLGPDAIKTLDLGVKPQLSLRELKERGVEAADPLAESLNAGVFSLDGEQGAEYWLAFDNFYALTRYNHSKNYAMAVYQLALAILQARAAEPELRTLPFPIGI